VLVELGLDQKRSGCINLEVDAAMMLTIQRVEAQLFGASLEP
jgi:hypothetical protein